MVLLQVVTVPAGGALMEATMPMDILPGFNLEGFPNRNSTIYADMYGIQSAHTLIRGTLRFKVGSRCQQVMNAVRPQNCLKLSLKLFFLLYFPVYQGFSKAMSSFVKLGLINSEPCPSLQPTSSPVSWVRTLTAAHRCSSLFFYSLSLFSLYEMSCLAPPRKSVEL